MKKIIELNEYNYKFISIYIIIMSDKTPSILKDYVFIKEIGEGNFGKVKLSKLISTNEKYAIKILNKDKLTQDLDITKKNLSERISYLHKHLYEIENKYKLDLREQSDKNLIESKKLEEDEKKKKDN